MPLRLDYPIRVRQGRFVCNEQDTVDDIAAGVAVRVVTPPGGHPNGDPGFGVGDPTFRSPGAMQAWVDAAVAQQERGHVTIDEVRGLVESRVTVEVTG